jgi:hypothetical protein
LPRPYVRLRSASKVCSLYSQRFICQSLSGSEVPLIGICPRSPMRGGRRAGRRTEPLPSADRGGSGLAGRGPPRPRITAPRNAASAPRAC